MLREILNLKRLGNVTLQAMQMALGWIEHRGDPVMLQIEATSRCNFHCAYCIVHNGSGNEHGQDMTESTFQEILHVFPHSIYLQLQGQGEPLLHPNFPNMIRYAKEQGHLVGTVTNGSRWDEATAHTVLDAGIDAVAFSVDLARKEMIERDRRGMDHNQVVDNLRQVLHMRDRLGIDARIGVSSVLSATTPWGEAREAIRFLDSLGIDFLMIGPLAGTPTYQSRYPTRMIDGRSNKELLARVMAIPTRCQKFNTPSVDTFARRCIWAWSALYINADGSVSSCANNHRTIIAPRFETDVLNLPHFHNLRKEFVAGRTPAGCAGCQYLLAHNQP